MNRDTQAGGRNLPGEMGLWIFIFGDLLLFALFFGVAAWDMRAEPEVFRQGKGGLDLTIGMVNTLVLLTGSWAVAMGTRVAVESRQVGRYLYLAALSGVLFLAFKYVEYDHLIRAGHTISENRFYTWYFFLTGYHAVHVTGGIIFLSVIGTRFRRGQHSSHALVEAAGCYWHLVDLLWIGIFLVLYLL